MKKILITGGAGFIGSHIAELAQQRYQVRILDNFRTGHHRNLKNVNCELIEGSVTSRDTVKRAVEGVEAVFHLAALVSVPESMTNISECLQINGQGMINLLEASAEAGVKRLIFSSSAATYGDDPASPKTEDMTPAPKSPYAITKLDGEYYCRMFTETGRLSTAVFRYFNVFGPRQDPNSAYAAAVPIFISRALNNADITIYGDGGQTRDFVFVKDVAAANLFMAEHDFTGVYNMAYGGKITILELAERIIQLTGSTSKIIHAPERAGDLRHSRADVGKLQKTGFVGEWNFERGLAETIAAFK